MARDVLLALDTATSRGVIGVRSLVVDGASHALSRDLSYAYEGDADHAERMLPELDRLMSTSGLDRSSIGAVVVDIGPGSFVGIRVGVSIAKGLSLGLGVPVVTVTSLEVLAQGARRTMDSSSEGWVVPVLDARRGEYFVALFDREGREVSPAVAIKPDALESWLEQTLTVAMQKGVVPATTKRADVRVLPLGTLPEAGALLDLGQRRWAAGITANAADIEPAYVRAPDATPMKIAPFVPETRSDQPGSS
ncbi:MAG: tRNA (adenosine(37)-N6)-threonylcarbamoyltransferase complex dimerization subunit type 1 TsaB [Polyangiaceae bacterium]